MRAPLAAEPLTTATALELLPRLGRFTTIWLLPKASEAGRFSEAMLTMGMCRFEIQVDARDLVVAQREVDVSRGAGN